MFSSSFSHIYIRFILKEYDCIQNMLLELTFLNNTNVFDSTQKYIQYFEQYKQPCMIYSLRICILYIYYILYLIYNTLEKILHKNIICITFLNNLFVKRTNWNTKTLHSSLLFIIFLLHMFIFNQPNLHVSFLNH